MRWLPLLLLLVGCAAIEPATDSGIPIGDQRGGMGALGTIGGRDGLVMQREQWFPDAWFPGRR
jgi:hypothetical protein